MINTHRLKQIEEIHKQKKGIVTKSNVFDENTQQQQQKQTCFEIRSLQ